MCKNLEGSDRKTKLIEILSFFFIFFITNIQKSFMINETALRSPKWMRNFLDFDINTIKN